LKREKKQREVLSYEDEALEDYSKGERINAVFSQKGKIVIIILAVCVVLVGIAATWRFIAPDKIGSTISGSGGTGNGYPTDIIGTKVQTGNIAVLNSNLAYVSDTSFVALNNYAATVANRKIKYSSPIMVSSGGYALIYNQDEIGFEIDTASELVYQGDSDDKILTGDITSGGVYALVTAKEGYASKLTVYNKDNTQRYAYYFADYYVDSVSINESGTRGVVSGVSSQYGVLTSAVYVLDFKNEEPLAKLDFQDNMIYKVAFMKNGNIAAIGDSSASLISSDYQSKTDFTYDGDMLTAMEIDSDNGFALSLSRSGDGRTCSIQYISQDGYDTTIDSDLQITSIGLYGQAIAVLSKETITVYNRNGEKMGEYNAGVDAKSIELTSEKYAYVLGISQIRAVQIN